MKICMLAPEFLPVWGGVGTYTVELVKHLPKNIEIHVVTPFREGFGKEKVSKLHSDFSKYFGSNVYIHYISRANDTFFYNAAFQYACLRYVPKLLKDEDIDIIHSHTAHMPDLLLMLRKIDKPIVTTVHTTIKSQRLGTQLSQKNFFELERSEKITCLMYPFLQIAENAYFKRKRFLVSPSNWMKRLLEDSFQISENVTIIPNSIDITDYAFKEFEGITNKLTKRAVSNKRIILYVGRLIALKGVDNFIEGIPEILKKTESENLLFVFVGPGDQIRYLNKVKQLKISDKCIFTGSLPKEQVVQLINASKMVIVPSFTENIPYTILESMACGVPVVANNVGGIPEIIENGYNGQLVKTNSPKMLARAIITLLKNDSLREFLGKQAKLTVKNKFSWIVNVDKYCKMYSDVMNQ